MKRIFFICVLLMMFSTGFPQLTHRGGSEMPAEIVLVSFGDLQPGDAIFSAYTFEGNYYASWKDIPKPGAATGKFFIRCMLNDNDLPVKTGVLQNEIPIYVLQRGDEFTLLELTRTKSTGYYVEGVLAQTRDVITLNDNLYYSICPSWPAQDVTTARKIPRTTTAEYFYTFFNFNDVLPSYYDKLEFEVETGDGRLYPSNTLNYWRYWFKKSDLDRGFINLTVKVYPFKNCISGIETRVITIRTQKL